MMLHRKQSHSRRVELFYEILYNRRKLKPYQNLQVINFKDHHKFEKNLKIWINIRK